jgi:hypothetical protein
MELLFGIFSGFIFGGFVILALLYVLSSLAFVKVFRKLGYQSPGLGWVPILNIFILATIVTTGVSKVKVLGAFELDINIYRFLWVLPLAVSLLFGGWGTTISYIFAAIYYGDMYSRVYASFDNTNVEDQTVLGAVSGIISIIFVVKVLAADNNLVQLRFRHDDVR